MKHAFRFILGIVLGGIVAVAVASIAILAARLFWPQYAAAEPHKQYTLTMLIARLVVGALSVAGGACSATVLAGDEGRTAWWLGGLFLALSIPDHLYPGYAWNDYPVWYHLVYLGYLVPIAGLTARLITDRKA